MDLDERFVLDEAVKRTQLVSELLKDKDELKKAHDEWPLLSADDCKKILEKMLTAHCKALDFRAPAGGVAIVELAGNDNGHYAPDADVIRINTKMPAYDDFELAMDLIFHENSHDWRGQLVKRLNPSHPKPLTPADDPPYTQALMFQCNNSGAEIVDAGEDCSSYQKQPWEDHSWTTGPKTARMLAKGLAT